MLQLLRKKPCMRSLLDGQSADSGAITAESVINLLKPSYSVLGSNRRQREEILVVKFRDILHSIQGEYKTQIIFKNHPWGWPSPGNTHIFISYSNYLSQSSRDSIVETKKQDLMCAHFIKSCTHSLLIIVGAFYLLVVTNNSFLWYSTLYLNICEHKLI